MSYLVCKRVLSPLNLAVLLTLLGASSFGQAVKPPKDQFVNQLIAKMTVEEKFGQLTQLTGNWEFTGSVPGATNFEEAIKKGLVGSMLNVVGAKRNLPFQQIACKESRLKIPLLIGYDVIHGYKTIFPIPLAESCSWDLDIQEQTAAMSALEASSAGVHWTFAPMVDVARDPRWGRVLEGAGEDTYYGGLVAAAKVKGYQGKKLGTNGRVAACAKHFAGYGALIAGREYNNIEVSRRELRQTYLPAFQAAKDAGVATFMTAYQDVEGIPATGNKWLCKDLLRKEWGFDGVVVTDWATVGGMVTHGHAKDTADAVVRALKATTDMDMVSQSYLKFGPKLLKQGKISQQDLDQAVRRVLNLKYDLGLFENPWRFCDSLTEKRIILSAPIRSVALEAARKSIVLLKNNNSTLPIAPNRSIALIGPFANAKREMLGSWRAQGDSVPVVTLLDALTLESKTMGFQLSYTKGCHPSANSPIDKAGIDKAVQDKDVIIAHVGELHYQSGEAASRSKLNLPGNQLELLQYLKTFNKPLILVLTNGRPLVIPEAIGLADAVLETWFLGTEAGTAISDALIGKLNPQGKLTLSWPVNEGQIPVYYNHKNTGKPFEAKEKYSTKYLDIPNEPAYAFGYGLSYTTYEYGKVAVKPQAKYNRNSKIFFEVSVKNTGSLPGTETAYLFFKDQDAEIVRPVSELCGFKQLKLNPGESKLVSFEVDLSKLGYWDNNNQFLPLVGKVKFMAGPSSTQLSEVEFNIE